MRKLSTRTTLARGLLFIGERRLYIPPRHFLFTRRQGGFYYLGPRTLTEGPDYFLSTPVSKRLEERLLDLGQLPIL